MNGTVTLTGTPGTNDRLTVSVPAAVPKWRPIRAGAKSIVPWKSPSTTGSSGLSAGLSSWMTIANSPVIGPWPVARLTKFLPRTVTVHVSVLGFVTSSEDGQRTVPSFAMPCSEDSAPRETGLPLASNSTNAFSDSS